MKRGESFYPRGLAQRGVRFCLSRVEILGSEEFERTDQGKKKS